MLMKEGMRGNNMAEILIVSCKHVTVYPLACALGLVGIKQERIPIEKLLD